MASGQERACKPRVNPTVAARSSPPYTARRGKRDDPTLYRTLRSLYTIRQEIASEAIWRGWIMLQKRLRDPHVGLLEGSQNVRLIFQPQHLLQRCLIKGPVRKMRANRQTGMGPLCKLCLLEVQPLVGLSTVAPLSSDMP